jgi:hypothetical protein
MTAYRATAPTQRLTKNRGGLADDTPRRTDRPDGEAVPEVAGGEGDRIEILVEQYQRKLEDEDDEDLLGDTLHDMRRATVENLIEQYQEQLLQKSDQELFGLEGTND